MLEKFACPRYEVNTLYVFQKDIFFTFLFVDLSDVISDDDEKENLSPDEIPSTVVIDAFGRRFEEAVRIALVYDWLMKPLKYSRTTTQGLK